jgi:hypothetical protein
LTAKEVPATAQEMEQINKDEAKVKALSQIESVLATIRAGRKRTASPKVADNAIQARDAKRSKTSSRSGQIDSGHCRRGGRGSGQKV